jgi:hypothetical protein
MNTVTIKKGPGIKMVFNKSEIKNIRQTSDGVIFTLNSGMEIYDTNNMPNGTKSSIESSLNRFYDNDADLIYDLTNYTQPITLSLGKI